MNNYLSIITLNVNGLNAPIKRHRIAEWIRKHDPHICCLQETYLRTKDLHRLKVKGWKQIFQANGQEKKAGVAILISDKIDFQRRNIKRDPGHFIILKGRIHQEDINIVNVYAPNVGAPKYIKEILEDFKKDIDRNTIIVGDFNTVGEHYHRAPHPPWMRINLPRHDLFGEGGWPISQRRRAKSLFLHGLLLGSFCTGIQVKLINHYQAVRIKQQITYKEL